MKLRVATALAAVLGLVTSAASAAECKFTKLGEIPIRFQDGTPLIDMTVNGKQAVMVVSTGATLTTITPETAARLGLKGRETGIREVGMSGSIVDIDLAEGIDIGFGEFVSRNAGLFIPRQNNGFNYDGTLGLTVLGRGDIEFDFANKVVRLFSPQDCKNSPLAYWSKDYAMADLEAVSSSSLGDLVAVVTLNGKRTRAHFHSSAGPTEISLRSAAMAGVTPDHPLVRSLEPHLAEFTSPIRVWAGPFDFTLGDETINGARIRFANFDQNMPTEASVVSRIPARVATFPDMVIGTDFFLAHRLYFARSQNKLYFTHNGGRVFQLGDELTAR